MKDDKEVGYITSAAFSPTQNKVVALGFIKKEFYENENEFELENEKVKCRINSTI